MDLEEPVVFGIWPRRLLVFEDRIEVRDFELLREKTLAWGHDRIAGVVLSGADWFANLLITVRGDGPILLRGLNKEAAERARALIEDLAAQSGDHRPRMHAPSNPDTESLMRALTDLRDAGVLSEAEFEAKRDRAKVLDESAGDPDEGG